MWHGVHLILCSNLIKGMKMLIWVLKLSTTRKWFATNFSFMLYIKLSFQEEDRSEWIVNDTIKIEDRRLPNNNNLLGFPVFSKKAWRFPFIFWDGATIIGFF